MSAAPIFFDGDTGRQDRPLLIFVEGTDDAHFVDVILQDLGADPLIVGIIVVGGTSNFSASIAMFKKSGNFRRALGVAIIRDADENPAKAIADSKKILLKEFKLEVEHGSITSDDVINAGLFVLPSNNENGDLEKLCLATVAGTQVEIHAQSYMDTVLGGAAMTQIFKRKSQVYLAGKPEGFCRGAGMGFKIGLFDKTHESLIPFRLFLEKFIALSSIDAAVE